MLELIAKREGMSRLYFPVQLQDDSTLAWVNRVCVPRGYAPDASLVSLLDFDSEMEGFEVFCKMMKPPAAKKAAEALPAAAAAAAAPVATVFTGKDVSNVSAAAAASAAAAKDTSAKPLLPAPAPAPAPEQEQGQGQGEEQGEEQGQLQLADALQKLSLLYVEKHGRQPAAEELAQWEAVLRETGTDLDVEAAEEQEQEQENKGQ